MCTSSFRVSHVVRLSIAFGTLLINGCIHPGMYYRNPYGQPMYAPPRSLNPGAPGTLYIPESGQPYVPDGGTYNSDPGDDFRQSDDGQFYKSDEGGVPIPPDEAGGTFRNDDLGPTTQRTPESDRPFTAAVVARPVSAALPANNGMPLEYGFDMADYRWLRGMLRHDSADAWSLVYSIAGDDRYRGTFRLSVTADQLDGLSHGDPVDARGHIDVTRRDRDGQPVYHIDDIRLMSTRLAM